MKRSLTSLKWIVLVSLISYMVLLFLEPDISTICDNAFIFNFLGILLGFSLTTFTFIVSMVEKIKDRAEIKFKDENQKINKVQEIINKLYAEIKDDIFFTFISLIIISFLYLTIGIKQYVIFFIFPIDLEIVVNSIKLSIFALNLYALYDLIITSFKLLDPVGILKKAES